MRKIQHICVCVCTFKRTGLLAQLLGHLDVQLTEGLFEYSIVIVDNDVASSARETVLHYQDRARVPVEYHIEPEQNIARARNMAVKFSRGDYVAFIDDDEFPPSNWLLSLFRGAERRDCSGVLGPVYPYFKDAPPRWVRESRLFERPRHAPGQVLDWRYTRTGNALLKRAIFEEKHIWFRPEYGSGGEDRDFFKRQIERGHIFVWCTEAPVYEVVPPERWSLSILIKRALLRGKMSLNSVPSKPSALLLSLGTFALYGISLPALLIGGPLIGFGYFVKYLIKSCDHLGRILAFLRIDLVKEKYFTSS